MVKPKPQQQHLVLLHVIAAFIGLILNAVILLYLHKLEKLGCECAYDWRRNYIIAYTGFMIAYSAVDLCVAVSGNKTGAMSNVLKVLSPVVFIGGVLFAIFGIQYVHDLQKKKCECSEEIGRDVLYIVAVVDAIFFILIGLLGLTSWIRHQF